MEKLHYTFCGKVFTRIFVIDLSLGLPGDKSDEAISETKSLRDEYDELVLSAASESEPLSSKTKPYSFSTTLLKPNRIVKSFS